MCSVGFNESRRRSRRRLSNERKDVVEFAVILGREVQLFLVEASLSRSHIRRELGQERTVRKQICVEL